MTLILEFAGFTNVREVGRYEVSCKIFSEKDFNKTRPEMSFYLEAEKI